MNICLAFQLRTTAVSNTENVNCAMDGSANHLEHTFWYFLGQPRLVL